MKPTELMIGDYFYRPDCIDRVVEIRKNGVIGTDSLRGLIPRSEIELVPLTPEILEKNGYHTTPVYDIDDDSIVYNHIDLCGEWTWYSGKIYYSITDEEVVEMFDCKYVHEFQHFLRLRGIEQEIAL